MSAREAEVLDAVAAHLSKAQIAGRLHISVRTVETPVRSLLRKFGAATAGNWPRLLPPPLPLPPWWDCPRRGRVSWAGSGNGRLCWR